MKLIVVMGPYRSGTSVTSKTLFNLGVHFGRDHELYEPSDFNPDGYFQRPDVTHANTDFIVKAGGSLESPPHPLALCDAKHHLRPPAFLRQWEGMEGFCAVKDPRFCATLAAWLERGEIAKTHLKIVLVARDVRAAAKSCVKHYDIQHFCGANIERAKSMLHRYAEFGRWHLKDVDVPNLIVRQEDFCVDPDSVTKSLAEFVGIEDNKTIEFAAAKARQGRSLVAVE